MPTRQSRKNKTRTNGANIVAAILLAALICLTVFFVVHMLRSDSSAPIDPSADFDSAYMIAEFLFFDISEREPVWEERAIPLYNYEGEPKSQNELLNAVLAIWLRGPSSNALTNYLPAAINATAEIHAFNVARIVFDNNLDELSPIRKTRCLTSLVWSLTSLPFVTDIIIYEEDLRSLLPGGEAIGTLNRSTMPVEGLHQHNPSQVISLHFVDISFTNLAIETRIIQPNPNRDIMEYIIEELIRGPNNPQMFFSAIPSSITLNAVWTESLPNTDPATNIAFVDFCANFRPEGGLTERFMIDSIVYSLTELDHISAVRFLINGDAIADDAGFERFMGVVFKRES